MNGVLLVLSDKFRVDAQHVKVWFECVCTGLHVSGFRVEGVGVALNKSHRIIAQNFTKLVDRVVPCLQEWFSVAPPLAKAGRVPFSLLEAVASRRVGMSLKIM